ncbi:MAG: hypothetical protein LBN04_10670 [Oscillospiraceae bacterium]|jgi:hypothetical protein|nr:hypothetical protein [Oscillospiraceae bacterium]
MPIFPRTEVAGISLPRLLIGSNWILGYSHTTPSADQMIKRRFATPEAVCELLEAYLGYGIDALMAPLDPDSPLLAGIRMAEQRTGKHIHLIDTPILDMADTKEGRAAARRRIELSAKMGSTFCLIHHASAELLVNKLTASMPRLPDYLDMIRQSGLIPGLSAHMPELILYSDENGYDVQTYIQIYNCVGFMMQIEVETVSRIIHQAKKPVMTIKAMAAGRVSPYVGLSYSFATIRPCDMVTLGAHTPDEVHEDVEIALAAIERRFPDMEGRSSPAPDTAILAQPSK